MTPTATTQQPIARERKSPFIQPFEPPQGHGICPGFYKLSPGIGCPYSCSYCYLDKTLRSMVPGGGPRRYEVYTNVADMILEITKFITKPPASCVMLNMGETLDSLATPELKNSVNMAVHHFSEAWNWFEKYDHLRYLLPTLLLLTKSTNIPDCDPSPNVVLSWSINDHRVCRKFEIGAPSYELRWLAAEKAKRLGWRVRLRIDPIINSQSAADTNMYVDVIKDARRLRPERITLGMLRRFGKPVDKTEERIKFYNWFIDNLKHICPVGLCKETPEVYAALGMSTEDIKCNCTP